MKIRCSETTGMAPPLSSRRDHQCAAAQRQGVSKHQDRLCSGASAAARPAYTNLLVSWARSARTSGSDIDDVVHEEDRNTLMDRWKAVYAQKTDKRTLLRHHIPGADIFLGLSAPNVLESPKWSRRWPTSRW